METKKTFLSQQDEDHLHRLLSVAGLTQKQKAGIVTAFEPLHAYLSIPQSDQAIVEDIKADPYKAIAHAAQVFSEEITDPTTAKLQNDSLEILQKHHENKSLSKFSGDEMKCGTHCTCEDGGIHLNMFKLPVPESKSASAMSLLGKDFEKMELQNKKYFSPDGGLGIYAQTHEFKDTDQ